MGSVEKPECSPEEYREFLEGLRLISIRMESSRSECLLWDLPEEAGKVRAEPMLSIREVHQFDDGLGFISIADTGVNFTLDEEIAASVSATYFVVYSTSTKPSEEMIRYFVETNIALHVWPYSREFVQSMVSRFGWEPYLLPMFVAS